MKLYVYNFLHNYRKEYTVKEVEVYETACFYKCDKNSSLHHYKRQIAIADIGEVISDSLLGDALVLTERNDQRACALLMQKLCKDRNALCEKIDSIEDAAKFLQTTDIKEV